MGNMVNYAALGVLALMALYVITHLFNNMRVSTAMARGVDAERELLQARVAGLAAQKKFEEQRNQYGWNGFRKFEVAKKVFEGGNICSFYLRPNDKKPLPPFQPGQFLTFRLQLPQDKSPTTVRCYSLSDSPRPEYSRVSIKRNPPPREGPGNLAASVSNFFHDQVKEGDILDVKAPGGGFYLDMTRHSPVVLIGGGVGLTPVLSMLNAVCDSDTQREREVWFFYGVRNRDEHIMREHFEQVQREHPNVRLNICYSDPTEKCIQGQDYHHAERVGVDLFKKVLPSSNFDYYLCGPPPMMQSLHEGLRDWGVPVENIHFEAFGPATVKKAAAATGTAAAPAAAAASQIKVTFAKSGKTVDWPADAGSLLEFAESIGIAMSCGCRAGNCGTCVTAVKGGEVAYLKPPGEKPEAGSCLTCISVPKADLVLDA
jgi:ferredoxin-NADP reductase